MTGPRSNHLFTPEVDGDVTIVASAHIPVHSRASTAGMMVAINKGDTQVAVGIGFNYAQNKFYAVYPSATSGGSTTLLASHAITPGSSHMVSLRKAGASLRLYVDGVKEAETSACQVPILTTGQGAPIALGGLRSINPEFTGYLGKFYIYKGVPADAVASSMETGVSQWMNGASAVLSARSIEGGASLEWTAPAGVSEFTLKRGLESGGPYQVIASGVTGTDYMDSAPDAGSRYYYVVAGVSAGVEGEASNEVNAVAYTPLQAWRAANGLPWNGTGLGADDQDPDGSGVPNLLKYALGIDPHGDARDGLPRLELHGTGLEFHFQRDPSHTDIAYIVEASSDLGLETWTPVAASLDGDAMIGLDDAVFVSESGDLLKNVIVRMAAPVPARRRQFLRLRVSH